jgi:hypothetical protein
MVVFEQSKRYFYLEGGNKASNETCAKANGRAEYIPAALSRYETNLSTETTG